MIKFETKYDSECVMQANLNKMKTIKFLYIICSLLFAFAGFCFIMAGIEDHELFGIIYGSCFALIFGIGFYPLCFWLTKAFQKSLNKTDKLVSDKTIMNYEFEENYFTVEAEKENEYQEKTRYSYKLVFSVNETKTHYFFYLSRVKILVVDKKGLKEGSIEELNKILQKNYGAKFSKYVAK